MHSLIIHSINNGSHGYILKRFTLTQKGTQRLTVVSKVSVPVLSSKEFHEKSIRSTNKCCADGGEKSLVLLMYNAGLSQRLQRRGKNHPHL